MQINIIRDNFYDPVIMYVGIITDKTCKEFHKLTQKALKNDQKYFPLLINSVGGDVYSLFELISQIRVIEQEMPIVTSVAGSAFSAAAILAALGTKGYRYISSLGTIMLHDVWGDNLGASQAHELKANADEMKRVSELMWRTLEIHTEQPKNYFNEMLDKQKHADMYIKPKDAVKHGLCDYIGIPTYNISYKVEQEIV